MSIKYVFLLLDINSPFLNTLMTDFSSPFLTIFSIIRKTPTIKSGFSFCFFWTISYFCIIIKEQTMLMRKILFFLVGISLLLSGCSSYTASGAVTGGQFGHVVGSAIGGITGGWRGHHVGSLIGTVGGAVAGAAIGAAVEHSAEQRSQRASEDSYNEQADNRSDMEHNRCVGQIVRRNGQNDCPKSEYPILLHRAAVYDTDHNGVLTRGEECTVSFEIMNTSSSTIYDIYPIVEDITANRHIQVSPNLRVESIAPYGGIRYTATILADRKLKDGEILIRVGVACGQQMIDSQTQQFRIPTRKR